MDDLPVEPTDIAVIGYHGRFPGADNVESLWDNLINDRSARREVTREEMADSGVPQSLVDDPNYLPFVYGLPDGDCFDAAFFGYTPREAQAIDPQHRLLLECAWNAMEHAGYATGKPLNAGVYAGCSLNTYILATGQAAQYFHDPVFTLMSSDKDFLATRIGFKMQLEGPSMTIQSACSTSLVAVHQACQALLARECDIALAGGSCVKVPLKAGYLYREGGMLSPDGDCRPFDVKASGTVFGSGVALVVLKRLDEALADGDTVHAVIKGTAINNDGGRKSSYTAPSVEGIAEAVRQAIDYSGVGADSISYVECHGTGTALGDPVEVQAMAQAFKGLTAREGFCAIGSVKGHIGHLEAAAGVAGLIKTIACLEHGYLPSVAHFTAPNPSLPLQGSPFFVNPEGRAWTSDAHPRTAMVNSLGVGGTNAVVILREAAPAMPSPTARQWHILPVSGKKAAQRDALRDRIAASVAKDQSSLADAAYSLQVGRAPFRFRTALIASAAGGEAVDPIEGPRTGIAKAPMLVSLSGDESPGGDWDREPLYQAHKREMRAQLAFMDGDAELERVCNLAALERFWHGLGLEPATRVGSRLAGWAQAFAGGAVGEAELKQGLQDPNRAPPIDNYLVVDGDGAEDALRALLDRAPSAIFLVLEPGALSVRLAALTAGSSSYTIVDASDEYQEGPPTLLRQAAALWAAGAPIDLARFYQGEARRRVPLPVTPFARDRHWWQS